MSLFDSSEIIKLPLQDAEIEYYPQFYGLEEANALFDALYPMDRRRHQSVWENLQATTVNCFFCQQPKDLWVFKHFNDTSTLHPAFECYKNKG